MLNEINLNKVFIVDIETVPLYESFNQMPAPFQELWDQKTKLQRKNEFTAAEFYERAGIWAEFGKIICISIGFFINRNGRQNLQVESYYGHDETSVLSNFTQFLSEQKADIQLCAHNGKEFDFPYLCRRILINGINIPIQLQIAGKKPWEINHIDTMELWKFGDFKNYTSLNLLSNVFNIPTPKDDIDGSMVRENYYCDRNLPRIVSYCEKDVITTAQILLRFKGLETIPSECINLVT
jgi:3'-5' exonuclease